MKKILICILICITGVLCAACTKASSTVKDVGDIMESISETVSAEMQTEQPSETETQIPDETIVEYELNTVESLEDDGKEMSAAEALRSTMKGKHSALELMFHERLFSLTKGENDEVKDMSDTGLARINMATYNRALDTAITPVKKARWESFVCVDLDQNGIKEILVLGGPGGVVLHYVKGEVYMTVINIRSFPYEVYENGVYSRDGGGAACTAYGRLYPAKGAMYSETLAYNADNTGLTTPSVYEIMNKAVTKEEYDAYLDELIGGLTPLEWHEFNDENIDRYVVD